MEGGTSGNPEHFPVEQFRRAGPDLCPGEHYHVRVSPQSLEGDTFFDNSGCGAGEVAAVRPQTFAVLESALALAENYAIPSGEGFFVDELGDLTIPSGITMTVPSDWLLINQGALNVDGLLLIESNGALDNNTVGVLNNAAETISNFGTINNRGTINNDGTITNQPGGVVNNTGTINGNPIAVPEPHAAPTTLAALAMLSLLAARRTGSGFRECSGTGVGRERAFGSPP